MENLYLQLKLSKMQVVEDRREGAKRMYQVMKNLEKGGNYPRNQEE
jgi:hypothetical protein